MAEAGVPCDPKPSAGAALMVTGRAVFDRMPALYLRHYRSAYQAIEDHARELGVASENLSHLLRSAPLLDSEGALRGNDLQRFASYDARGRWRASWDVATRAGLAERVGEDWRLSDTGRGALARGDADWAAYIDRQPAPAAAAEIVAAAVREIVSHACPDDWRATMFARRIAKEPRPMGALAKALAPVRALLGRRDDSHVAAWRASGYDGPTLDALTAVVSGARTLADVARALDSKQDQAQVERSLSALAGRGDIQRDGEAIHLTGKGHASRVAIEADTDRRFFGGWPEGDDLAALDGALAELDQTSRR